MVKKVLNNSRSLISLCGLEQCTIITCVISSTDWLYRQYCILHSFSGGAATWHSGHLAVIDHKMLQIDIIVRVVYDAQRSDVCDIFSPIAAVLLQQ